MEVRLDKITPDNKRNLFLFTTSGFSMWPFLKQGDRVIAKKIPVKELKIGDIALYQKNGQMICHRLVRKIVKEDDVLFYVRGDNSFSSPELISENAFIGKVIGIVENDRVIVFFKGLRWRITSRFIVIIAPLVSRVNRIIKPGYKMIFKLKSKGKNNGK